MHSRKDLNPKMIHKQKSAAIMTPKLVKVNSKGNGNFDQLRRSKISDAELKEEIIKDLTDKKYRRDGSKKQIQRNISSQFSGYLEQRKMSNSKLGKNTASSHLSE